MMERLERVILQAVSLLPLGAMVVATALLYLLCTRRLWDGVQELSRVADLQHGMPHVFAGVLALIIGLEVHETRRGNSATIPVRLRSARWHA